MNKQFDDFASGFPLNGAPNKEKHPCWMVTMSGQSTNTQEAMLLRPDKHQSSLRLAACESSFWRFHPGLGLGLVPLFQQSCRCGQAPQKSHFGRNMMCVSKIEHGSRKNGLKRLVSIINLQIATTL